MQTGGPGSVIGGAGVRPKAGLPSYTAKVRWAQIPAIPEVLRAAPLHLKRSRSSTGFRAAVMLD